MYRDSFFRGYRSSESLEKALARCKSLSEFEEKYPKEFLDTDARTGDYLRELLIKYDKKDSAVSEAAHLHTSYVGNIVRYPNKRPSRNTLICIAFAIGTTEEELQYLLKYCGYEPLYVRERRDVVIWYGIMKGEALEDVNTHLLERGLSPLYGDK